MSGSKTKYINENGKLLERGIKTDQITSIAQADRDATPPIIPLIL